MSAPRAPHQLFSRFSSVRSRLFCQVLVARLAGCMLLLSGCSSIQREWNASLHAAKPKNPYAGRWTGEWRSTRNPDEGGKLRCILTPEDATHTRTLFEAHWKVFSSRFSTVLATNQVGNRLHFQGVHPLPEIFGGAYRYKGFATADYFELSYSSRYDTGTFHLSR